MKKIFSILMTVVFLTLSACSAIQKTPVDENAIYTVAAKTVSVQLTSVAALTPSATLTSTPKPTLTPTLTPIPSATPLPPTPTWAPIAAGKVAAPIFLYYRVAGNTDDDPNYQWDGQYYISPNVFRQRLEVLKKAGYNSVTISQLVDVVRNGGTLPPHPFVMTFEAASISLYKVAYPIMKEFGYVGTVYAIVSQIDGKGMASTEQLKEMIASGWEVGSKGMTGIDLSSHHDQAGYEISTSRIELGKKLGVEVKTYSYTGAMDSIINGARVSQWGYQSAVGVGKSYDITDGLLYYLPRYEMRNDLLIADFANLLPQVPANLPTQVTPTRQGAN
jgi:peptidoglycan/xylan/chitin deacetylase (PgdA/CDA1 family)